MASGTILKELKEIYYCLYDSNGNERVIPIGVIKDRKLSEGRLDILRNFCKLLLETDIIRDYTKMYIKDRNIKVKNIVEYANEQLKNNNVMVEKKVKGKISLELVSEYSYNNIAAIINYDKARLEKIFGDDILTNVVYKQSCDIEGYQIKIGEYLEKYGDVKSLRDNLIINIRRDRMVKSYAGDFIEDFGDELRICVAETIKNIESKLNSNDKFVGYFNYLLSSATTNNSKVLADREKLFSILKGEYSKEIDKAASYVEESIDKLDKQDGLLETGLELDEDDLEDISVSEEDISVSEEDISDAVEMEVKKSKKEDVIKKYGLDLTSYKNNETSNSGVDNKYNEGVVDNNKQNKRLRMQF